jgi:hypothetical protein
MANLLAGRGLDPIICTLAEAYKILMLHTLGYAWGASTIKDLWSRCAPMPDSCVGTWNERRIIAPNHLGEWLADVLERQGRPLDDSATIYLEFLGATTHGRRNTVRPGA